MGRPGNSRASFTCTLWFEYLVPLLIIKTHFQVSLREVVDEVVAAEAVEDEVCSSLPCCLRSNGEMILALFFLCSKACILTNNYYNDMRGSRFNDLNLQWILDLHKQKTCSQCNSRFWEAEDRGNMSLLFLWLHARFPDRSEISGLEYGEIRKQQERFYQG